MPALQQILHWRVAADRLLTFASPVYPIAHMQYVYKGLQRAENSGLLLKIHAQLVEKCGLGTIVRAICDRKTA